MLPIIAIVITIIIIPTPAFAVYLKPGDTFVNDFNLQMHSLVSLKSGSRALYLAFSLAH